jgi:hypothetical protein
VKLVIAIIAYENKTLKALLRLKAPSKGSLKALSKRLS